MISLPNKWVKEWGIKKGDELELEEKGSTIKVKTEKDKKIDRVHINTTNKKERVMRWELSALHKKGHDEIDIWHGPEQSKIIKQLLRDLYTGFEIVERTDNRTLIRSISKDDRETYEQVLRRAFLNTIDLAESLPKYYEAGEETTELLELEKTNNKLTNFCQRILNKYGHEEPAKTTFMYTILWNLEKIADDYKYIIKEQKEPGKETIELMKQTAKMLREYYELYYKFDGTKLNEHSEKSKELQEKIKNAMKKEDTITLSYLLTTVQKIRDFAASTIAVNDNNPPHL